MKEDSKIQENQAPQPAESCSIAAPRPRTEQEASPGPAGPDSSIGKPAPELSLPLAGGGDLALRSLQGRSVLVTFLSHAA